MLLGCIADDFTRATGLVQVLARQARRRVGLVLFKDVAAGADPVTTLKRIEPAGA